MNQITNVFISHESITDVFQSNTVMICLLLLFAFSCPRFPFIFYAVTKMALYLEGRCRFY